MADGGLSFFRSSFEALTLRSPYCWQEKLFERFVADEWPDVVDLPTGAGKTAVLYVWLLAIAWSLKAGSCHVPRRLVWVVNRRVVVDQITAEIEELLGNLGKASEAAEALKAASASDCALRVGTLRGQHADSGDWARDPSTPAVVVGTVDMIGSRLLFRGYQVGAYRRPVHAGLLAVDALIVNDESHLSPAFARLLLEIRGMSPAAKIPGKSFRVLLLSATHSDQTGTRFDHSPEEDCDRSEYFRGIFEAPKHLTLHEVARASIDAAFWRLATDKPAGRTIVFIENPERAAEFRSRLTQKGFESALLTGTMRGFERDKLAEDDVVFRRFLQSSYDGPPSWLVATSAAELGVNITCERMLTGLVAADRLLQRFGRLNRFGFGTGNAHVVYATPTEKEPRLARTVSFLESLGGDVSCKKLWSDRPIAEARSEIPKFADLEPPHIECWAQTCFKDKSVPAVAPYLNGKQEEEAPETEVVWRKDVKCLGAWGLTQRQLEDAIDAFPVHIHEILREPTARVLGKLKAIVESDPITSGTSLIVVASDGTPRVSTLGELVADGRAVNRRLILPVGLGSLDGGMFRVAGGTDVLFDVAEEGVDQQRRRLCVCMGEATWLGKPGPEIGGIGTADLNRYAREHKFRVPVVVRKAGDEEQMLVYFRPKDNQRIVAKNVFLSDHSRNVANRAAALASACGLRDFAETFHTAGQIHDLGKNREVWQRAMDGSLAEPLAKSASPRNASLIGGYRHELGSLREAGEDYGDLPLHLTATHHKAGRPYFESQQLDREAVKASRQAAAEQVRRFARMQARFGAWGIAYLEAIFKCADGLVSAEEGEAASA